MNFYKYKIKYYSEDDEALSTDQGIVLGERMEDTIGTLKSYYTTYENRIEDISITLLTNPEDGEILPLAKETLTDIENQVIW